MSVKNWKDNNLPKDYSASEISRGCPNQTDLALIYIVHMGSSILFHPPKVNQYSYGVNTNSYVIWVYTHEKSCCAFNHLPVTHAADDADGSGTGIRGVERHGEKT